MAEKSWREKAMDMIGMKESPKENFSTNKKTYQTKNDEDILDELAAYKELLKGGKQNVSLRELISQYYGGDEKLNEEIEKAKAYALQRKQNIPAYDLGMTMDYDKVSEKIPIQSGSYTGSSYYPERKKVIIQDPVSSAINASKILDLKQSNDARNKRDFDNILYKNYYTEEDLQNQFKNPLADFMGTLEHEVGHHSTTGKQVLNSSTHMDKPEELSNQLGRIQRESFYLYGKRFTPETLQDFIDQQKSIPEKERFQDFSPDTRRGLRKLFDLNKESKIYKPSFDAWESVKESIPDFVDTSDYENTNV